MFNATLTRVANRGIPPVSFLQEMLLWGKGADSTIFSPNDNPADIYASMKPELGPWLSPPQRRAAMLEAMRVLAGFESSWKWNEGRDTSNPTSDTPDTIEAGAWQVSANSRSFGDDLKALAPKDGNEFQHVMKANHPLAMEYIARLLRHTLNHNGPAKRHEINPWLSRAAVAEWQALLA